MFAPYSRLALFPTRTGISGKVGIGIQSLLVCTIRCALLGPGQEECARLSLIDEPPGNIGDFGGPARHGEHFFLLLPTVEGSSIWDLQVSFKEHSYKIGMLWCIVWNPAI